MLRLKLLLIRESEKFWLPRIRNSAHETRDAANYCIADSMQVPLTGYPESPGIQVNTWSGIRSLSNLMGSWWNPESTTVLDYLAWAGSFAKVNVNRKSHNVYTRPPCLCPCKKTNIA